MHNHSTWDRTRAVGEPATGSSGGRDARSLSVTDFHWPVRVYYEDTDTAGVVYYANYLKFMERARTEFLRSYGFEQDELARSEGVLFAVRSANVEFLEPARFNDSLIVTARVAERRRVSLSFEQSVYRADTPENPLCTGSVRIVCLDSGALRPRPIPERILKEIPDVG